MVQRSQNTNIEKMETISNNLANVVDRSETENQQFERGIDDTCRKFINPSIFATLGESK